MRELLVHAGEAVPARTLAQRVEAMCAQLRATGVCAGQILALFADDALRTVALRHALQRLGAGLLPLAPSLRKGPPPLSQWGVEWLWERGQPRAVCGDHPANAPDTALLLMTSGSLGEPKGVMLSEGALRAAARRANQRLGVEDGDTWLVCLPFHHMGGLAIVERCRQVGCGLWLQEGFDVAAVAAALAGGRVTHLSLVPAMLWRLLEAGVEPPPSLRMVLIGGQALSPALAMRAHEMGWPLYVSYGASETGGMIACESGAGAGTVAGRVGALLPDVRIRSDESGSLQVRGPMLMSGYANPERRPGQGLVDGWFCSGDLGSVDSAGALWVRGRRDDVLVSGGENVHPLAVEGMLAGTKGLGQVALSGSPDPVWGTRLVLFYTGTASPEQAEALCRERLVGASLPRQLIRVDALPLLETGKLDRRRLAQMAAYPAE